MGLFDFIKSLFSSAPEAPPSAEVQEQARAAWRQAAASGDFNAASYAAQELGNKAWLWDECIDAHKSLFEQHPDQRGHLATMLGQHLYLGKAGYRATLSDADKAAVYVDALGWYVRAAELGDRSQDLNYVEMCEWLAPRFRPQAQPFIDGFERNFPGSEYLSRMTALKA